MNGQCSTAWKVKCEGGGGAGRERQRCWHSAESSSALRQRWHQPHILPPFSASAFSVPPSLLCSLFLSCSPLCRLAGMKSWQLIKTPHPPSLPVILPTCSLHHYSLLLPLIISPSSFFFPVSLIPLLCSPAALSLPASQSVHLLISYKLPDLFFPPLPSSLPQSAPFSPASFPILSLSPCASPFTSTPTSERQRRSVRNREKMRASQRERMLLSALRQSCHQAEGSERLHVCAEPI